MAIYKRGKFYWYKFRFNGELIRESTKQKNQNTARDMESTHRSRLAKGEVGIREKKVAPTLAKFIEDRFEPWAKATFEENSPKTWLGWYRPSLKTIGAAQFASRKMDEITS